MRAGLLHVFGALAATMSAVPAAAIDVGLPYGYYYSEDVEDLLGAQADIDVGQFYSCNLTSLDDYDAIILYGNGNCWSDEDFEDYVAAGGGVIGTPWAFNNGADSYSFFPYSVTGTAPVFAQPLDPVVVDAADGMLAGVTFVPGDVVAWEDYVGVTLDASTVVPATHADGDPLVAYGYQGIGRIVYLDLQYLTSDCDRASSYAWGQQLLLNAVYWASGQDFCQGVDGDADGFTDCDGDCDDGDPAIHPGAAEVCDDGVDSNCDGQADETADDDGDGYSNCDGDCDDAEPDAWPGNAEVCDGVDNDCDGWADDGFPDATDQDHDGQMGCEGDCDDTNPATYLGATEACDGLDNDCDGSPAGFEGDVDGDGYLSCEECDDYDATVYPGADDACDDGVDSDCLDDLDETEVDDDGDGLSECGGDCDDDDPAVHPDAVEICNDGVDDDCNPQTFEDVDLDGDGFDLCGGDCDDADADVGPEGVEVCDGKDNDCNGLVDDGLDADLDGYDTCGDDADCDDTDPDVHPGAPEIPDDGVDSDCDGYEAVGDDDDGGSGLVDGGGCGCDLVHESAAASWIAMWLAALVVFGCRQRSRRRAGLWPAGWLRGKGRT